jgi:thioredoxin reductase (NADPH)
MVPLFSIMYDVAIIGAGPAGITAAIYAARYRLKTLLVSPEIGGWAAKAYRVENWPGHVAVSGKDIKRMYTEHIKANDVEHVQDTVQSIARKAGHFELHTDSRHFEARYAIYALGTKKRMLGVPGEEKFLGKGVCLCATCDAPFFRNKKVAVIGGNDSGATSALLIAEYATKVMVVELLDKLPAEPVWLEKLRMNPKIRTLTGESVKEIRGDKTVNTLVLKSGTELSVDGIFIEIGQLPENELAKKLGIKTDQWGYVVVDASQQTSVDGCYAAGDITNAGNYLRQIVVAQAEGAIAAQAIYKRKVKGE